MLMCKKTERQIFEALFKDGVMIAKKQLNFAPHPEVGVPNIYVIKTLQSLHSKGYVKEQFAWSNYYWFLKNEGIQYLREKLHLPPEIVPETLKKAAPRSDAKASFKGASRVQAESVDATGRSDYRHAPGEDKKEVGAGSKNVVFNTPLGSGMGRGTQRDKSNL